MLFIKKTLAIALILSYFSSFAQPSDRVISRNEYIEMWKDEAIKQMVQYKIPASITLAQGILESANGNSELARYANNHFGIKCHNWTGETMHKDDDHKDDCFRKYLTAHESFQDHSEFLQKSRYQFLYQYEITDYKAWAKGLKKAGYATNPKYPELLIKLIEAHNLDQYDQLHDIAESKGNEIASAETIKKPSKVELGSAMVNIHMAEVSSNKIKYITVKEGDTYYKIAKEFDLGLWQLYKYNDLTNDDVLLVGDVIYLQPKKNKAKKELHVVEIGETMKSISQKYGVKLKKLYKRNEGLYGQSLKEGQKVILK